MVDHLHLVSDEVDHLLHLMVDVYHLFANVLVLLADIRSL